MQWPEAIRPQEQYLGMLLRDIRTSIAQGQFMEDIVASVGAKEKQDWLLYDENHKRNVTRAFTELEWE